MIDSDSQDLFRGLQRDGILTLATAITQDSDSQDLFRGLQLWELGAIAQHPPDSDSQDLFRGLQRVNLTICCAIAPHNTSGLTAIALNVNT